MQYFNLIYIILRFFGHKIHIQLKVFFILQKKSLRILCFLSRFTHTSHLFKESKILNIPEKIALEN